MRRYDPGYIKLRHDDGRLPEFGFESTRGEPRPRWPDPEFPQQAHLDVEVGDLDSAEALVLGLGATRLQAREQFRVFADPIGHPFCLCAGPLAEQGRAAPSPGRIARVVFDCSNPRTVAQFYEALLGMRDRVLDTPERVVIAGEPRSPMLAFQQAQSAAPQWPDPRYPAQFTSISISTTGRKRSRDCRDSAQSTSRHCRTMRCTPIPRDIRSASDGTRVVGACVHCPLRDSRGVTQWRSPRTTSSR